MRKTAFLIGLGLLFISLAGCKMVFRSLRYNVPSVYDHKLWEANPIHKSDSVSPLHENLKPLPEVSEWAYGKWAKPHMTPEKFFESTGTLAYLVMRGDTILYENYFNGNHAAARLNGFSTSKAFLSALVGIAVAEGKILSIDQSIGDYLPWCTDSTYCSLKIRHLLQMTSGIDAKESYFNPWSTSTKLYYGDQMPSLLEEFEFERKPGKRYYYQNINSQLLGAVLTAATGKTLSAYLEEKIWRPLGMESDASWSVHEGTQVEKAFCCINARARDLARFGLLYLNQGNWHGKQIVPKDWATLPLQMDTTEGAAMHYQYAWYTNLAREDFYAQGLLGQFIYIHPASRTVIVRLGNNLDYNVPWYDIFRFSAGISTMPHRQDLDRQQMTRYEGRWYFGLDHKGDSAMVGKWVDIHTVRKGLRVKSTFQKTWIAEPSDSLHFFNLEFSRYLRFSGDADTLHWERRGLKWPLYRTKPE